MMPFNGSYMSKDNHAYVDFKGTPVKVTINEKNCYYQLEGDKAMRIINYVVLGTETKMGTGPDAIYPSGQSRFWGSLSVLITFRKVHHNGSRPKLAGRTVEMGQEG